MTTTKQTTEPIGWKPKGPKEIKFISDYESLPPLNGSVLMVTSQTVKELKEVGILEILCDPVYPEKEKKEEWNWIKHKNTNGDDLVTLCYGCYPQFDSLNNFLDTKLDEICDQLNRPAHLSEPSEEAINNAADNAWIKDTINNNQRDGYYLGFEAGAKWMFSRDAPTVKRLSDEELKTWADLKHVEIKFSDTTTRNALIEMGKRVRDFYEKGLSNETSFVVDAGDNGIRYRNLNEFGAERIKEGHSEIPEP